MEHWPRKLLRRFFSIETFLGRGSTKKIVKKGLRKFLTRVFSIEPVSDDLARKNSSERGIYEKNQVCAVCMTFFANQVKSAFLHLTRKNSQKRFGRVFSIEPRFRPVSNEKNRTNESSPSFFSRKRRFRRKKSSELFHRVFSRFSKTTKKLIEKMHR